jgi:pimeloyl-ACP methyl ester carboxylesterase
MSSIDEGLFVEIGGVSQWLTLRGADRANPALLMIGGAGFGYSALAPFFAEWERDFTLLNWDQPGAGFTFAKSGAEVESIAQLVDDGCAAAAAACARLRVRRLTLLCFSAGTIVGLQMLKRRPELFSAYVGSGQVVDWRRQDALSYELLVRRARERRDTVMLQELQSIGPPPYADAAADAIKSKYAGEPTAREAPAVAKLRSLMSAAQHGMPTGASYLAAGLEWPDPMLRTFAAYTSLRADIVAFDARRLGPLFEVPMFFLQGADDVFTVSSEVERYAGELVAPRVEYVAIEGAGHAALLLADDLHAALSRHVLPRLIRE